MMKISARDISAIVFGLIAAGTAHAIVMQTASPSPSSSASPTQTPSAVPTVTSALTGSTAAMQAAGRPGIYNATTTAAYSLDGHNLVNNQLLDDAQAAALVVGMGALPYNSVETAVAHIKWPSLIPGRHDHRDSHPQVYSVAANQTVTGDNYYENANPTSYAAELANWRSTQTDFPSDVAARVDGAVPISNPTFAQINAWAALKWGLNPALGLGEAMEEDSYNINAPGDVNSCADTGHDIWGGCSTGFEQVADRGANHGWSGLLTNNLAAESTAFHMDFFYMHYYADFNYLFNEYGGLTGPDQIVQAIQYWCGPSCTNYSTDVLNAITAQGWVSKYYGGKAFTIAPPVGTGIPNL